MSQTQQITKLQATYLEDVKRVLSSEAEKGNVFPSMWTLHYPDGEQTIVRFIDESENVHSRIEGAFIVDQPRHEPLVFIASSMHEAQAMADARSQ